MRNLAGHDVESSVVPLLLTLGLGVFAGALDLGVLSPALPALQAQFGVSTSSLAWIFTLYLLVNIVSIAVASALADRYGRRPIYIACVGLFAAGSVLAVAAPSYTVFLIARAVQALGAGGIFPVATAAIGDVVPQHRRGAALGLVAATWGLAAIVGPTFGGIVTHFVSWRWIFAANFPLAAVVIAMALRTVPARAPRARGPLDVVGLALLALGLAAVMDGLTRANAPIALAGLAALVAFAIVECRSTNPIVAPALFANTQLVRTYILEIVIGVLEGSLFFVPTVLVSAQGLSVLSAGAIAAVGALVFVAVIPASGRMLDRTGSRAVLQVGTLLTAAGLALFAATLHTTAGSIVAMVVAGAGFGSLLGAPTRYIVTNETTPATRATAVGLLSQALIVGQILGGSFAGGMLRLLPGTGGYVALYAAFSGLALIATLLALGLKSRVAERTQPREEAA